MKQAQNRLFGKKHNIFTKWETEEQPLIVEESMTTRALTL